MTTSTRRWLVDANNVMGSRPDGWWNDRPAAMARLAQEVAEWCWTHDDAVVLVFDGPLQSEASRLGGGNLDVQFAERSDRDAADDHIVALIEGRPHPDETRVVTADNGLIARLPPTTTVTGPRRFLELLTGR